MQQSHNHNNSQPAGRDDGPGEFEVRVRNFTCMRVNVHKLKQAGDSFRRVETVWSIVISDQMALFTDCNSSAHVTCYKRCHGMFDLTLSHLLHKYFLQICSLPLAISCSLSEGPANNIKDHQFITTLIGSWISHGL
jgi:hypothetical protein